MRAAAEVGRRPVAQAASAAWSVAPTERRARSTSSGDQGSPSASSSRRESLPRCDRGEVGGLVREPELLVGRRPGVSDLDRGQPRRPRGRAGTSRAESGVRRQRVGVDVVGERLHGTRATVRGLPAPCEPTASKERRGLVLGVANRRSIAWAIAQQLADGGAQLAFTYQGERIEKNVRELAESVGRR